MPEAKSTTADFGWRKKLRKADEFSSVFRFKRVKRGQYLDVHLALNGLDYTRLGLIVGKKVFPRAVDRNRVRRIVRENFRLSQTLLSGLDIVVRVKLATEFKNYREESQALLMAASRYAAKEEKVRAQAPFPSELNKLD